MPLEPPVAYQLLAGTVHAVRDQDILIHVTWFTFGAKAKSPETQRGIDVRSGRRIPNRVRSPHAHTSHAKRNKHEPGKE